MPNFLAEQQVTTSQQPCFTGTSRPEVVPAPTHLAPCPPRVLTGVESGVLLHVGELLEASVTVGALVGLLAGVHPDVLHQLVVGGEGLQALLTLVRLHLGAVSVAVVHLHGRLVHEDL